MTKNPYETGQPVHSSSVFIGRKNLLAGLYRNLGKPNVKAIVLFGQRRMGKTSVIRFLEQKLPKEDYFPVYISMQGESEATTEERIGFLASAISRTLGIPGTLQENDYFNSFQLDFLPEVIDTIEPRTLLVLFDEFDILVDPHNDATKSFFTFLRLLIDKTHNIKFVFISGRSIEYLANVAQLIFGIAVPLKIGLLDDKETRRLILKSSENDSLSWSEDAINQVWLLTHGHPYFTQKICEIVWNEVHMVSKEENPIARPADVLHAIPSVFAKSETVFNRLWSDLDQNSQLIASALAQAGEEPISTTDLEAIYNGIGSNITRKGLKDGTQTLLEWDILETDDGKYRFQVELFRQWIVQNYPYSRIEDDFNQSIPVADRLCSAAVGLMEKNKLQEAEDLLVQAVGLEPFHVEANLHLINVQINLGKLDEALLRLEEIYDPEPDKFKVLYLQTLLKKASSVRDIDTKISLYSKAKELDPNREDIKNNLATLQSVSADYELGIKALEGNNYEMAQKHLKCVVAVEPAYKDAARYLYVSIYQEDPEKVRRLLKRATARIAELEDRKRKEQEARETDQQRRKLESENRLSLLSPKSYFSVFLWTLYDVPDMSFKNNVSTVGKWLVSSFLWLPLLVISISLAIFPSDPTGNPTLLVLLACTLSIIWLVTGWIGDQENTSSLVIAFIVSLILSLLCLILLFNYLSASILNLSIATVFLIICSFMAISLSAATMTKASMSISLAEGLVALLLSSIYIGKELVVLVQPLISEGAATFIYGLLLSLLGGFAITLLIGVPAINAIGKYQENDILELDITSAHVVPVASILAGSISLLMSIGFGFNSVRFVYMLIAIVAAVVLGVIILIQSKSMAGLIIFGIVLLVAMPIVLGISYGVEQGALIGFVAAMTYLFSTILLIITSGGLTYLIANVLTEEGKKMWFPTWSLIILFAAVISFILFISRNQQ